MSLQALMVHDVTIVHAGTSTDRYGNIVKDWSTATTKVSKGWITQTAASEDVTDREAEIGTWTLFLPAETVVTGRDRVTWDGLTFEVVAPPRKAWTPRGEHHIEAQLRIVEG